MKTAAAPRRPSDGGDPLWYKDAIIYQLHIRAFFDSDGDGIGDFRGLEQKLDYLHDLGVNTLWLLPFYPSPLRDDGYDIADYRRINPPYGSMRDFQSFLNAAHQRGLRIVTELVLNHTSDEHEWFQRARRAPAGSKLRNYYVWSDAPDRYPEARIIFKDFETSNWAWDPVANQYYWHRFYSHQPDLNFDNPAVREEALKLVDYWFDRGVDGLRLDAIPYLYERDGTNCENLPETHAFLKQLRKHTDDRHPNRMLLAEANQWPEDACDYFGDGDECHAAFHFPLMPRLFMSIRMEDRFPIIDILRQTPEIPETAQWMLFLRNHDELTLEMVTDEERDYMYRVYANDPQARVNLGIRRRLAPLLGNNRRRIELMNGLLFSLPGTVVLYYGDEIGMGDNIYLGDRNGVRTPMQWSGDRNAGFSRANPQKLFLPTIIDPEYHYETVNVEAQQNNPSSLLWWMKRLIALRKRHQAFGRGAIEFLYPDNNKVLTFVRSFEDETILVVANLSRFVQAVELDLSQYQGGVPVEMFGNTPFPAIGELPYFLSLGPHSFYWFKIEGADGGASAEQVLERDLPSISITGRTWEDCLRPRKKSTVEAALLPYLRAQRWFAGKARRVRTVEIEDAVPFGKTQSGQAYMLFARVLYHDGDPELYVLPVGAAFGEQMTALAGDAPEALIARLDAGGRDGVLFEALSDERFRVSLLESIAQPRRVRGGAGQLATSRGKGFRRLRGSAADTTSSALVRREQSNTSVTFGDRLILKLYRRPDFGENPELEVGRHLTEVAKFENAPALAGAIEYQRGRGAPMTIAVMQELVLNQGDAWTYSLDALRSYYEHVLATPREDGATPPVARPSVDIMDDEIPVEIHEAIGPYVQSAELLGERTAEMHNALAQATEDPAFRPEPFTTLYQRSLYQSMRSSVATALRLLRQQSRRLPVDLRADAEALSGAEDVLLTRMRMPLQHKLETMRIRRHGDYHLGQVLYTGRDFVIIDFEGEPARPLTERRLKRSALTDVAGMLRSLEYAAQAGLRALREQDLVTDAQAAELRPWADVWHSWCGAAFLRAYVEAIEPSLVPRSREALRVLLDAYLIDKAVYELAYELNNRPDWVDIPLRSILRLLNEEGPSTGA